MAATLRSRFPDAEIELIQGGHGDFIVVADGQRLWDKRNNGNEFPDPSDILPALERL